MEDIATKRSQLSKEINALKGLETAWHQGYLLISQERRRKQMEFDFLHERQLTDVMQTTERLLFEVRRAEQVRDLRKKTNEAEEILNTIRQLKAKNRREARIEG